MLDVLIVGAGPAGIAVGLSAQRRGLNYLLIDKGSVCETISRFPAYMRFFSTADLLEFPGLPFPIEGDKPRAYEVLNYFTRIVLSFDLRVATHEAVRGIRKTPGGFAVQTSRRILHSHAVVLAIGTYDHPNLLDVPGETLPHVSHYFSSAHRYLGRRVAIVGGKNSAAEAALDIWRRGGRVTLIHRGPSLREASIKYWLLPDIQNRLTDGAIAHSWNSTVREIYSDAVVLSTDKGEVRVDCDDVLLLTGYHPDYSFLRGAGIELTGERQAPSHDPESLESTVEGLYIAGVLTAGADPSKVFIENARHHGELILNHLVTQLNRSGNFVG